MDQHVNTTEPAAAAQPQPQREQYDEPVGGVERAIAHVWEQLFGREYIGRNDDFFELGGDSLIAMEVVDRLAVQIHVQIPAVVLFQNPTPRLLAESINAVKYSRSPDFPREQQTSADDIELLLCLPGSQVARLLACLRRSRAQFRQDLFVLSELHFKERGFFVEICAADGGNLSNTHLLETQFGWKGIVAEATMTTSLSDLITRHRAPPIIDYLSVSTGGSEFEILRHLDFTRFRFGVITYEHNFAPEREDIHSLLSRHGYLRKYPEVSKSDDWYAPAQ